VDQHPMDGARKLQSLGVTDREWLRAVLEHHETQEGTGYPRHVKNPSLLAVLIHTCDVYASLISGRTYRKPLLASDAAKKLYLDMAHGKDNPFAGLLIKEVGMYPPGTFLRLANGEVGVVKARNPEHANAPVVAVLINTKGLRQAEPVLRQTASDADFKVAAVLPRDNSMLSVNFDQIWSR
jgi:HD-GYP domain-containing protein (c-di-GMP phosphodiesterase class II)